MPLALAMAPPESEPMPSNERDSRERVAGRDDARALAEDTFAATSALSFLVAAPVGSFRTLPTASSRCRSSMPLSVAISSRSVRRRRGPRGLRDVDERVAGVDLVGAVAGLGRAAGFGGGLFYFRRC